MTIVNDTGLGLAGRLKASRQLAGLDQAQVADRVGVARQTVSGWERGLSEPSVTHFVRWANATGQTLEWLAGGVVRPEGFEPPAYWSVASADFCPDCGCRYESKSIQLFCRDGACDCHHEARSADDAFWAIVEGFGCSCESRHDGRPCPCVCHDGHSFWSIVEGGAWPAERARWCMFCANDLHDLCAGVGACRCACAIVEVDRE